MLNIHYICPAFNQGECTEKTKIAYTDKLTKEIANQLRSNCEYFHKFDKIIVYYDYGQTELAQILISVFNTMFSNVEFRKIETNFPSDSDRATTLTDYAKEQKSVTNDTWWLINSYSSDLYKYVVNSSGEHENSPRVNEDEGVRPAIWVKTSAIN